MIGGAENRLSTCIFAPQTKTMKKLILVGILSFAAGAVLAQKGQPVKATTPPKVVPKPAASPLKTLNDSASYAIGVSVANFYKQQGVTKLNTALVTKAINEIMAGKPALLDDQMCNNVMNTYMTKLQESKSGPNIKEGEDFLAKNKLRPGVKTTASGLQYEVMTEGTGEKPTIADSVTCNYKGTLVNGTEFDNSYTRGAPITFSLRGVIAGWTEALQLMSVGSKYKLFVPHTLGYGPMDYGPIPGGSALIFEVELLAVKKVQPQLDKPNQ